MARMHIFFFVVMMVATPDGKVQAENIDIEKKYVFYEYNDMMKKQVKRDAHIFLSEDSDRWIIGWKDFIYLQYVVLLSDDRLSMSQLLDKYFEWRLIAVKNKVSDMDKEIGTVDVLFMWKTENREMQGARASMTLGFLAQTETRHQLYI